jgi:hypothetical protein
VSPESRNHPVSGVPRQPAAVLGGNRYIPSWWQKLADVGSPEAVRGGRRSPAKSQLARWRTHRATGHECEHVFALTLKGSIVGQLRRALEARDVLAVRSLAGELPTVPLPTAAEITLLLREKEPESYTPAARRLLARLASERAMPLRQLADVAAILAELEGDPAISRAPRLVSLVQDAPPVIGTR